MDKSIRLPWFVWEHADHSGLQIGPRYGGSRIRLEDHVEAVVYIHGDRYVTDEQRQQAAFIALAVNSYAELVDTCKKAQQFWDGDYAADTLEEIQNRLRKWTQAKS
jgi:hypothetical protein